MSFRRKFSLGFSRVVNHLRLSRPGVRHATGAPSYQDAATTMEKLDAALNNMSHGLCMFGPDNRLLLWNDRYVKMYKLAPDSLRVGCTLDEMLEARKAAGTAYRDLGQYGSKLHEVITTRSPDSHPRPEYSRTRNPMIPAATLALSMSLRLIVPASPFDDTIPGNISSIAVTRESRASGK